MRRHWWQRSSRPGHARARKDVAWPKPSITIAAASSVARASRSPLPSSAWRVSPARNPARRARRLCLRSRRDPYLVHLATPGRCRRAQGRLRGSRPRRWPGGRPAAWLALRHPQLRRRRAAAGVGGLPRDRAVPARLRRDALPVERHAPQRPAGGPRRRHHRPDGCAPDREGDRRRLRLGRADGGHHRRALARALQGPGLRERLSDRQPGSRQDAAAAEGRARMVVPVLLRHRARPRRLRDNTGASSPSSSGSSLRRNGPSTTPRSSAARPRSTTRITSPS